MGPYVYFSLLVAVSLCVICLRFLQMKLYTPAYGCITISSAFFVVYCSFPFWIHVIIRSDSFCSDGIHTPIQTFCSEQPSTIVLHYHSPLTQLRCSGIDWHVPWVRDWIWATLPSYHLPYSTVVPFFHSLGHLCWWQYHSFMHRRRSVPSLLRIPHLLVMEMTILFRFFHNPINKVWIPLPLQS